MTTDAAATATCPVCADYLKGTAGAPAVVTFIAGATLALNLSVLERIQTAPEAAGALERAGYLRCAACLPGAIAVALEDGRPALVLPL